MNPSIEAFKEIARLAVFAAVGAIFASLIDSFAKIDQNATTVIILAILRFADKWVHENKDIKRSGILPF